MICIFLCFLFCFQLFGCNREIFYTQFQCMTAVLAIGWDIHNKIIWFLHAFSKPGGVQTQALALALAQAWGMSWYEMRSKIVLKCFRRQMSNCRHGMSSQGTHQSWPEKYGFWDQNSGILSGLGGCRVCCVCCFAFVLYW